MLHAQSLLFITRKWDGHGGMQQLSRDVWKGMEETFRARARLCVPMGRSPLARCSLLVVFVVQAMVLGMITVWQGGHVHLGDAALAPLGWLLKKVRRGQVTIIACGLDVIWPRRWYQWMLRRTLLSMDRVVCISRATAEHVQRRGVAEEKIVVIPCGVWLDACFTSPALAWSQVSSACPNRLDLRSSRLVQHQKQSKQEWPILLTVGRLVPRKGVAWFVREVVPSLLYYFPHLQYWIIGSGPDELLIKKIIQEKGLKQCVHLLGELGNAAREECIVEADLLLVPNIPVTGDMEGFGIVCIEASARGVPVVAARLEGLADAVMEGETGRFFTPGNAGDCVRVVKEVLHSGVQAQQAIVRATLEHYGWPRLLQRYRDEVFRV